MRSQTKNSSEKRKTLYQLQKKMTYSTLSSSRQEEMSEEPLSPLESSEAESHELKYLSHLDQNNSIDTLDDKAQFLSIYYHAVIYVRKDQYRTEIDDGLLHEELKCHINLTMQPSPLTQMGVKLLTNGYVLVAISILMARIHKSTFLLSYFFNLFTYSYDIIQNEFELFEYSVLSPKRFDIPSQEIGCYRRRKKLGSSKLKRSRRKSEEKELKVDRQNEPKKDNN